MRKLILALAGATALTAASAANAALTVVTCDPSIDNGCTVDNSLAPAQSSISWSDSNVGTSANNQNFTGYIDFNNTLGGNYFVSLNTADPSLLFNALTITPLLGGAPLLTYSGGPTNAITLLPVTLDAGSYHLSFGGTSPNGGPEGGTLFFRQAAVPEPATWALMLFGFGAMGMVLRKRRRPMLAQIA